MPAIRIDEISPHLTQQVSDDERWARRLLDIFVRKGVRPNEALLLNQARLQFQTEDGRDAEFRAGLTYAALQDWLVVDGGALRITTAGYKEGH